MSESSDRLILDLWSWPDDEQSGSVFVQVYVERSIVGVLLLPPESPICQFACVKCLSAQLLAKFILDRSGIVCASLACAQRCVRAFPGLRSGSTRALEQLPTS